MKKTIVYSLICLLIVSCSKSDSQPSAIQQALKGKWRLVQGLYIDPENPDDEHLVIDGYIFELSLNGTFTSSEYQTYNVTNNTNYVGGNYQIYNANQTDYITFNFHSPNKPDIIDTHRIMAYSSDILDLTHDLTPDGTGCFEGCGGRFKKIN